MKRRAERPLGRALPLAVLLGVAGPSFALPPTVKVEYSGREDTLCSLLPGSSIKNEWKAELLARHAEFVKLWETEGPRLLATAEALSGKAFSSREATARLTLCNTPSESSQGSDRVTVNMRFALRSFTASPVSFRYKAHTLFHEMLHLLLFRHPVEDSVLVRKHAAEHERVRGHLHLLALQKAVLLKLGQDDALKEIISVDSALPGGHYRRAWEIVNASEGEYLKYVAELAR